MLRRIIGLAVLAGGAWAGFKVFVEPWWRAWGTTPGDQGRPLPGDDLIEVPSAVETRAITINAPPGAIWPWLKQMGFGRAGWYSYDQVDMAGRSASRVMPEHQDLDVGDVMPTHPGGGFLVKAVEPERTLVLYTDTDTVGEQARAAADADPTPTNLKIAGAFMENAQPTEFAATWAFYLDPIDANRTRLIERFRIRFGDQRPWMRLTLPMMGFGVFAMVRKQLLGIRDRVERAAAEVAVAA
jgi:hypothetical protein